MDMSSRRKRIKLNPQDYQEKNANAHIHITVQVPRSPQGFIVQNAKNKFPSLVAPTSQHVTIPVKATQKHLFQVSPTNSTSTMNITMTISVDNCNEMDEQDEGKDDRSEMSELTNNTRSTNGDISEEEEDIDDDDDDDDTGSQCSNSMSHTDLKSSQWRFILRGNSHTHYRKYMPVDALDYHERNVC